MSAAREASAAKAAALPPSEAMIATVSLAAAALRSTQNTCAPSRAKVTAVALAIAPAGPDRPGADHDCCLALEASHSHLPLFSKLAGRGTAVNLSHTLGNTNSTEQ